VSGSIRDGVFDGEIVTEKDGVFYVERARRYFPQKLVNSSHHSVIYHERHVTLSPQEDKQGGTKAAPGCGADHHNSWMEGVRWAGETLPPGPTPPPTDSPAAPPPSRPDPRLDPSPLHKYTQDANNRVRRSLDPPAPPTNRKSCSLFIQTDPLLWKHIMQNEPSEQKAQEEILSLIAQHVKAVNRIYRDTEFNAGKYRHFGHSFEVQRIKIHNDTECTGNLRKEKNQFCLPNIDVSNFLNLHSKENHEHFCLAYVFTYRDFTGGTLGLAWVASASGASGGICERYKTYTENNNGIHLTSKRSLNTGIITFVNYNSRVPPKVSQLTLAHEIGHNFGSPHDYPEQCHPGGAKGNYIMFASATSGDRNNNNKFSTCSIKNISAVLDALVDGKKNNCFTESEGAFCGNKIVEDGEECDCGFNDSECDEQCCYPRVNSENESTNKLRRCTLKTNTNRKVQCSPSIGPCCDQNCHFIPSSHNQECKGDDECTEATMCSGKSAKCPRPKDKPDNVTECNKGTKVCQAGECTGSICFKFGLEQCFLSSSDPERYSTRALCDLACQEKDKNNTCQSTGVWSGKEEGRMRGLNTSLSLRPGSPCDNFQGYCDVFRKCRQVDAEGPLVRLKNLLFNQKTLLSIKQWITTYWYAVLCMAIAFVVIMALFIKCCAAHTPSSNPKLPKNKHIGETLRRPMHTLRRKRYQQAPRSVPPSAGYSVPPSTGAPPPYPGAPRGGPGHGYGDGRGHYNRSKASDGAASQGDRRSGADRRSWAPQTGAGAGVGGHSGGGGRSRGFEMSNMSR
jgi:disintegrin and metalloproteinase domain-containing protein 10